jgi:hypothetical protein
MFRLCLGLVLVYAGGVALSAQEAAGEWMRPYPMAPGFWELVGRVFPDTPEARRDRDLRGFLDPSILAAGSIKAKAREQDIVGTFVRFLPVANSNVLNAGQAPDRLAVADVLQVIFLAYDGGSLRLETRIGNPSSEFQTCYDGRHTKFAHLADIRVQAAILCEGALFWASWRGQPAITLDRAGSGSLVLDQYGTLLVTFDPKTTELSASIRTPEVGSGAGPQPR